MGGVVTTTVESPVPRGATLPEGVTALCRGLRTNCTLKQLHMPYCGIGALGGAPLAEMLSYAKLTLTTLNLQGNQLGGTGIHQLCPGLARSQARACPLLRGPRLDAAKK